MTTRKKDKMYGALLLLLLLVSIIIKRRVFGEPTSTAQETDLHKFHVYQTA